MWVNRARTQVDDYVSALERNGVRSLDGLIIMSGAALVRAAGVICAASRVYFQRHVWPRRGCGSVCHGARGGDTVRMKTPLGWSPRRSRALRHRLTGAASWRRSPRCVPAAARSWRAATTAAGAARGTSMTTQLLSSDRSAASAATRRRGAALTPPQRVACSALTTRSYSCARGSASRSRRCACGTSCAGGDTGSVRRRRAPTPRDAPLGAPHRLGASHRITSFKTVTRGASTRVAPKSSVLGARDLILI